VVMHLAVYCGIPVSVDAMRAVRDVLAEMDSAKAKS
jgi:alkylhydroperoxidase/carboxymuconolactone decarboxylase family protein YurZ